MTNSRFLLRVVATSLAFVAVPAAMVYAATLTEHMDIECRQPAPLVLQCDYRMLDGAELASAAAQHAEFLINGEKVDDPPSAENRTAILFLIDTSDPARESVVAKNREHVQRMVESAPEHHIYGLASFDADLEILCELGCSAEEIASSAEQLSAKGQTTELYRNVLGAIKRLRSVDARRRQIILMSDGLAEDLAYHHEDVIAAARKDRIVISSVGYPRTVAQSVALQTLRRLSEETGGLYVQASHIDYEVPAAFLPRVMSIIDSGGRVEFALDALPRADVAGAIDVSLAFQTTEQSFLVLVPVTMPQAEQTAQAPAGEAETEPAPPVPVAAPLPNASATVTAPPEATSAPREITSSWFWYGLPAMVFSAILALAIIYALIARRRREDRSIDPTRHAIPHAFLILGKNEKIRYKIDHTPWRIGRSRNNDLTLDHTSVSRLHAEIRRDALGQFTVQDLESLNGVFVNGEAIEMSHLDEKDRVEVGDVSFIFTMHDEDYAQQDATVLIGTQTPFYTGPRST